MKYNIPEKILIVLRELELAGYEAFLVGGSVRDLLRGVEPKDWDITTNAKPEEVLKVFPDGKYENDFGTVILPLKYINSTQLSELSSQKNNNSELLTVNCKPNIDEKDTRNKIQDTNKLQDTNSKQEVDKLCLSSREAESEGVNSELLIGNCEPITDNQELNVEITTYRIESTYSDNRRPDEVKFAETLEEDLGRRDFTCNAIALRVKGQKSKVESYEIIDPFNGQQDIKNQVIRAVGDVNERFNEDALRMMRAVRFASQLSQGDDLQFLKNRKREGHQNQKTGYRSTVISSQSHTVNREPITDNQKWWIGENTFDALKKNARLLKHISPERISDEFQKIILSDRPAWGVELLVETGLMKYIIPEVLDTIGVRQNRHHYNGPYNTVYKHMLAALKTCPSEKLEVRLAAFFHDIGKPKSKRGHGYNSTFYGHEYIGARITKQVMERLKFPRKVIDKTVLLVKNHMFYYNTDEVGEKGVRKVIRKVGLENINDLIDVRIGDRLGSGVAKAVPYKLRHFKYMVEKVSKDPISVKDLKINGDILLADYDFKPGPQMGAILEILLAEVLDDPKLNTIEYLSKRALDLQKEDLQQLRQIAKDKIKEEKQKEEQQTKGKYWVK